MQMMNSMDSVFKKEEVPMIIAQFWQQVGTVCVVKIATVLSRRGWAVPLACSKAARSPMAAMAHLAVECLSFPCI